MINSSNEMVHDEWGNGNDGDAGNQDARGKSPKYNGYPGPSAGGMNRSDANQGAQPRFKSNNSNKVVIHNVPSRLTFQDLDGLLLDFGSVVNIEKLNTREGPSQVIQVTYTTAESALRALTDLNNYEYEGNILRAEKPIERRRGGAPPGGPRNVRNQSGGGYGQVNRPSDFPLRILVANDMVGAIIGRQGSTIRQITQQTRARRVDVHRKDNLSSMEKSITIYGSPESSTNACKKILEVMQQEASATSKPEVILKMLAHNSLIGRIIGKGGNTIKRIMETTDTKIAVSSDRSNFCSINEINNFNAERIIMVRGTIDNMSKAESLISAKLRQSYENDLQTLAPQTVMFPGLTPMALMATQGLGYSPRSGPPHNYQPPMYAAPPTQYPPIYQPTPIANCNLDQQETVFLYIPNQAVGALIGTKGSQIRNMIRFSSASIKIAAGENERPNDANERKVTIVGTPEAQWKAQYMIFEKMREEGFSNGMEEIRMTVEILVPSTQVGRIIGRGGSNVRDLQRHTGANIKLPEHNASSNPPGPDDETVVQIIGTFLAVQSAQRRIRSMISAPPMNRIRGPRGSMPMQQMEGPNPM